MDIKSRKLRKQRGFAEIVIVVVVLVLAGLVGAYYLGRGATKPSTSPTTTSTAQKSPLPQQDETANWRTYKSIDGKYSVQYPKEYTIEETNSIQTASKYPAGKKQVAIKPSDRKVNFIIYINYYPIPNPAVTNEVMQQVSGCDVVNAQKINNAPKGNDFILDSQKATMYENSLCAQFTSTNFYVSTNNRVYSIFVVSTEKYNLHKTLVEQILSTFRFD